MFSKFSYKQKLKLLVGVAMLALIICYKLAFSNTIVEYENFSNFSNDSLAMNKTSHSLPELMEKEQKINELFSRYLLDTLHAAKNLLTVASDYCIDNNLKLNEYKPLHFSKTDSIQVLTRIINVEGSFIECVKLLHELEAHKKVGRIGSADFKSYMDPVDKKMKLNCTIYIQNLIPVKNEND